MKFELNLGSEIDDHCRVIRDLGKCEQNLLACIEEIRAAMQRGGKLLLCGNGGSAADAQHLAAEFVGRFKRDRAALPAIALTTDTSILTCVANDFGYDALFARQIEAVGNAGDVLIALSTSGNSKNVLAAAGQAKKNSMKVIGLTGCGGGGLAELCDILLCVSSADTARIQEAHIFLGHLICQAFEA